MHDFHVSKATIYRYLTGVTPDQGGAPSHPASEAPCWVGASRRCAV